ncbi:MAG: DUF1932 domain-containing protein [Cellulomonas sp.]
MIHNATGPLDTVGLIGYGEVGRILAEDLRSQGVQVVAYDLKLDAGEANGRPLREHAASHHVVLLADHGAVAAAADLVVSAVTADQDFAVALASAPGVGGGTFFLDLNSASPGAKGKAATVIDAAGGRYVEGAVMTSIPPYRSAVPLLLGGPHARDLEAPLRARGFTGASFYDERLGVASATKMCRSVMIKGLEAMVIESFTAARAYGVEDAVLASLKETFPGVDWEAEGTYFFQRAIEHGRRRSEEVWEVAETVRDVGLEPLSATATASRQAWVADLADAGVFGPRVSGFARSPDWRVEADRILAHVSSAAAAPTSAEKGA